MTQKTLPLPRHAYVETPYGGDYLTCPLCQSMTDIDTENNFGDNVYHYCEKCNILFTLCCTHIERGCTDDVYFAKLITSFTNNNNEKIYAMPVFNSINEAITQFPLINPIFTCYNLDCKFNNAVFKCYESKCLQ